MDETDWLGDFDVFTGEPSNGGGEVVTAPGWDPSSSTDDWIRLAGVGGQILSDSPGGASTRSPDIYGGEVIQTGGGAALMGAGIITLGRFLASRLSAAAAPMLRWALPNGTTVVGRLSALWPAVRKYGPLAVAGALGISTDRLFQLLASTPKPRRRRGRGVSAADVRRTRRTLKTIKRMYYLMPTRPRGGYGGGGYRRYSSRRRYYR